MEANQLTAEELAAIREKYELIESTLPGETKTRLIVWAQRDSSRDIPRLLATVEAALLSIEDQAAIIADRDATVEALRAENERLRRHAEELQVALDEATGGGKE